MHSTPNTPRGWVLYDGGCGICSRWVPFWKPRLSRLGLDIAPLQAEWVRQQTHLSEDELLRDIRLLLADGTQVAGADVYRYVLRRTWWAFPMYVLSITPGLRSLFNAAYRAFARRRLRISAVCRITPPSSSEAHP